MSFFKELFEKRKDKKYGKGHRLGETSTPRNDFNRSIDTSVSTPRQSQTEAAKKAGEAAELRFTNVNKPINRPTTSNASREAQNLRSEIENTSHELQKALNLKNHYFGKQASVDNVSTVSKVKIYYKSSVLPPSERYPLNEIEDKIEQFLIANLDDEPILVSVSLLFTANYKNQEKLDKCVEIINKFVDNILKNPNEEKYRKIRLENPIFKEKVYSCKYADMVLKKSGFKATRIKKDEPTTQQAQGSNESSSNKEAIEEEDYFVFEGDNFEKLESLKSALSLAEPILPELDRDLRVFLVTNASSTSLNDFNLSEDFFNLKIEELRREQALRNEAIEKAGMLRTKAMRERDEHLELRRYNYSLIRIKFPDNIILQVLFKSNEKYEDLYDFVCKCLEIELPFDLVSHSMKKTSNESFAKCSLAELGLAPSALLNFKLEDSINQAIKSKVKHLLRVDLLERAESI